MYTAALEKENYPLSNPQEDLKDPQTSLNLGSDYLKGLYVVTGN